MDELFELAEKEMIELKHPYVGTEHFLLAYLKKYGSKYLDYNNYRNHIIKIIGSSTNKSDYVLYTPILRNIRNDCDNIYDCMIRILTDDDSIAYNLLLSMGVDIEAIYLNIINTNY